MQVMLLFWGRKQASCHESTYNEFSCVTDPKSATAPLHPESAWSHPQDAQNCPLFTVGG